MGIRFFINVRHGIVVVKHHGVEAELFELRELPIEGLGRARGGAVGVLTFAEIPGSEAKLVLRLFWHRCYVTFLRGLGSEIMNGTFKHANFAFPNPGRSDIKGP